MKTKIILLALSVVFTMACGSKMPVPSTSSRIMPTKDSGFKADVDPDISRIYGEPSLLGTLPSALTWSPDGAYLAFFKKKVTDNGPVMDLWLWEAKAKRERPLIAGDKTQVDEFVWLNKDTVLVTSKGGMHTFHVSGKHEIFTDNDFKAAGIQASPDGNSVAFIREHNLHVFNVKKGTVRAVTTDGTLDKYYGDVSWVYGEEFGTGAGFGWSPDSSRLWLYAVDDSLVSKRIILTNSNGDSRVQAYPRAGENNPILKVGVADLTHKKITLTWMDTGNDKENYLPSVVWKPNSKSLAVIKFDRLQTLKQTLVCKAKIGTCNTIIEERDPRWLNHHGDPHFLKNGDLLWISERSGYSHIYLISDEGRVENQITDGDWVVTKILHVDEANKVIYFRGNLETPISYGVFSVPFGGGDVTRISAEGGVHYGKFSPSGKIFADMHSTVNNVPRTDIFKITGEKLYDLAASERKRYSRNNVSNDIFSLENEDGVKLWAQMTRPKVLSPNQKYPVLVYVYGGPGAQVVQDQFRTSFQAWRNLLAERGIIVFSLDNRGSTGRGREFETKIHRNLAELELKDQLAGIEYLKKQPYIDPARIGIFGWSYGGTMALNALLRTEGIFKMGVSVAPVTDWTLYDTAYTERYMQRPEDNPKGYEKTSLFAIAKNLKTPLLLVHGIADDNVHFVNGAKMVDALIDANKDFEVMFFPGKKHSLRGPKTRVNLFTRVTRFIERHL